MRQRFSQKFSTTHGAICRCDVSHNFICYKLSPSVYAAFTHRSCILEEVGKKKKKTHSNTPRNIQFAAQFRRKTRSITRVHLTLHAPPHETTCPASHHLQKPVCTSLSNHPIGRSPFLIVLLLAFMGGHYFE